MYTLKIQNDRGEMYELTHNRSHYTVLQVTGLTLPHCNVSTAAAGTQDGEEYNSSHLEKRNIVITLALEGDIEGSRQLLYRIFPVHAPVKVFYKSRNRDVYTEGYVESLDGDLFSMRETMQISILCPGSYWKDVSTIRAKTTLVSGVPLCRAANSGTAAVGFTADITIRTDDTPTLTVTSAESETADALRQHCADLAANSDPGFFGGMDFGTQTVNISVNGILRTRGTDYTCDILTHENAVKTLWLETTGADLTNAKILIEKIAVTGQSVTDMRYFCSDTMPVSSFVTVSGIPPWFDIQTDCIVFAYVTGAVGRILPTAMTAEQQEDGTYTLRAEFSGAELDKTMECRIYGSVSRVDVHDAVITRKALTWNLYPYRSYLLAPEIPAYTGRDVFRVYNGSTLLDAADYRLETVTRSDGTAALYFELTDGQIRPAITFEVIKSISGEDIHEYTQTQIDAGMCLVAGLTLTNLTTGESMAFPDISFRSGDRFTVSTVPGDLHVTVTKSDWMPEGKSLLYEVQRYGTFFRLVPGENRLRITAASNADYVSLSLRARALYGGV